jgi:LuxR family maltose regulon positive regulatory protein
MASRKRSPITPPKISAPRLIKTYPRTRLFKSLDSLRHQRVVWISGPAGAGKTTLAVSYLCARNLKFLWYQFDIRDRDPAAFFYYLREAMAKAWPRRKENLPLLTPEYLAGLPTFTRNFFEALFARMRAPAALVFDNFQDLPEKCITQGLLESALSEIPQGIRIIFLSRGGQPAALARFKVEQSLHSLDAESLKINLTEARGIARLQNGSRLDWKTLEPYHERFQGWMAGWILLLTHLQGNGKSGVGFPRSARDTVFQYFAAELFDNAAPAAQELLLKTSLLPQVAVSSAISLTGITGAAKILEELEHRNYFTTRLASAEPVYQFHPLFHDFLRERLARDLSAADLRSLQRRAASLLCERTQYDDAAALMIESEDDKGLAQLALTQAPMLAQQGRFGTLASWLLALPMRIQHTQPWIAYWLGMCRMLTDLKEARNHLERAYTLFKQKADPLGQYSAWAGIIESYYYQWDDFTPIDPWFDELELLQHQSPLSRWPHVEVRVVYAVVIVFGFARADRHDLKTWVERAWVLWNSNRDLQARGLMMTCLGLYYFWKADAVKLRPFLADLRQFAAAEALDPFIRLQSHWILSCQWIIGDLAEAEEWLRRALTLSERVGVRIFDGFFFSCGAAICQIRDDVAGAARYTELLRQTLAPSRRIDLSLSLYYASWLAQRRGDFQGACSTLEQALDIADRSNTGHARSVVQASLAEALTPLGNSKKAMALIDAAENYAGDSGNAMLMYICLLARAWDALRNQGITACAPFLSAAFRHGREHDFTMYPGWLAPKMSELCACAIRLGIEIDYTSRLIRLRRLVPDPAAATLRDWPFPVKIHALGHFTVLLDDQPLKFTGKTPKKSLELLMILIAFGGRFVSERTLATALWPQAADPMQALATTLHRLRKLIGDEVIERQEGKLSLSSRHVWVDVRAFEHGSIALNAACQAGELASLVPLTEQLITLYGDGFLAGSSVASWAEPLRDKLQAKMLRQLEAAALAMVQGGQYSEAVATYRKALRIGPAAEFLHVGLMQCYQAMGRIAEALAGYDDCRAMLREHSGVSPSAQTEALARALRGRL